MVLLSELISKPVSSKVLEQKLPPYAKFMLYSDLLKDKRHRTAVFGKYSCLVVLYEGDISGVTRGHYVALIKRPSHIEYFSSMGFLPKHEQDMLGLDESGAFERLLGKSYKPNRTKLQSGKYTINDCAYWTLARVALYRMPLPQFVQFFTRKYNLQNPDQVLAISMYIEANR